jgi:acyl-coenzyme A thioesterase PaaI-like protein
VDAHKKMTAVSSSHDEVARLAAAFVLGSACAMGAMNILGFLPLWFGPEVRSWNRDFWDSEACRLLDEWDSDSRYRLYRPMESTRNFLYNEPDSSRRVRRVLYFSRSLSRLVGVVKFGADTEGPPRCVHGGCTAAVIDAVMGVAAYRTARLPCVTASLTVNYRAKIPLGTCALIEVRHLNTEGRKSRFEMKLMSLTAKDVVFADATGLFINAIVPSTKSGGVPAFLKF